MKEQVKKQNLVSKLERVIASDPKDAEAYFNLGNARYNEYKL